MTKKNPDDSVREEQFGANENAAGTEDATAAQEMPEDDSLTDSAESENDNEDVSEKKEEVADEVIPVFS